MKEGKSIHKITYILTVIIAITLLASCENNNKPTDGRDTLFFYYPWSSNLSHYFQNNIEEMKQAIMDSKPEGQRIIVFMSETEEKAYMYELKKGKQTIKHDTLRVYNKFRYTTAEGLTQIIQNVKETAPAERYSMVIGCHGDGWIPAKDFKNSFGGTKAESRTDIATLDSAIANTGIKMEYILFDVCYMSTIEVIHQLRHSASYIIGTPTEMMGYGMPYSTVGKYLMGTPDYESLCREFYQYYSTQEEGRRYGALAVSRCDKTDTLASVMAQINERYGERKASTENLQAYDGYRPHVYYDLGDYVNQLCRDTVMLGKFNRALEETVPYKCHTEYVYTTGRGEIKVERYSGISTSEPSENKYANSKKETSWHKATHR